MAPWENPDKRIMSILEYIHRHKRKGVKEGKLLEHFKIPKHAMCKILIEMSKHDLIFSVSENGEFIEFDKDKDYTQYDENYNTTWHSYYAGNQLVESKKEKLWRWLIPLIFSALALLISAINLLIKLCEIYNSVPLSTPIPSIIPTLPPIP